MATKKQLLNMLSDVQGLQRKKIGKVGMSIMTGIENNNFMVLVDFNVQKMPGESISSEYKEFLFDDKTPEDKCREYINEISELS